MAIKRLVIDVLTPRDPSILTYAENLSKVERVESVSIRVVDQDDQTRTTEMFFEGQSLQFEEIRTAIERMGGSIHSIDQVSAESEMLETEPKEQS